MPSSPRSFLRREPASCFSHRFATLRLYDRSVTGLEPHPQGDQSLRGHATPKRGRGLPTALPAVYSLALYEAAGVGFAVMSGIVTRDRSRAGQLFTRQGISLP